MKRTFGILAIVLVLTLTAHAGQAPKQSPSVASRLENKIRQAWQDWKDKKKDAFAAILTIRKPK